MRQQKIAQRFLYVMLALLLACHGKEKQRSQLYDPQSGLKADSLRKTLTSDSIEIPAVADEHYKNLSAAFGIYLIKYDYSERCNFAVGLYYITKGIPDSANLIYMSRFLAKRLYRNQHRDPKCNNSLGAAALIYPDFPKYQADNSSWLVSCTVTAENEEGQTHLGPTIKK